MREWAHPTKRAVLAIHEVVLAAHGGLAGVRDEGLLESALAAPQAGMFGRPLFEDPLEIGAAYLFYLCKNHPFLDGNKRTALAVTLVFLHENGVFSHDPATTLPVDAWESLVLDVASGKPEREQVTARLRVLAVNG